MNSFQGISPVAKIIVLRQKIELACIITANISHLPAFALLLYMMKLQSPLNLSQTKTVLSILIPSKQYLYKNGGFSDL